MTQTVLYLRHHNDATYWSALSSVTWIKPGMESGCQSCQKVLLYSHGVFTILEWRLYELWRVRGYEMGA